MSDEDILTVGETAPAPADIPAAPLPRADPVESRVAEGRHTALSQLAKSEDIEGYAQERIDQEDYFDRGEKLDERRDAAWFRRAHKALQDAALEAQGIKLNEQGEPEVPPPPPPGYVPGDEAMREVERARKEGAAAMRIQQYFGNNTERKEQITQWHQAMDPEGKVATWVIENESTYAPQIMEKLADNPEALQQLAEMPANQRQRWLGALEGHIAAEQNFARQMAGQQQQWQQERRVTQAPPIIRPPRGGANPPKDLRSLATKDNATDYIKARQEQERRYKEKWE